jgi:hypothetical protein
MDRTILPPILYKCKILFFKFIQKVIYLINNIHLIYYFLNEFKKLNFAYITRVSTRQNNTRKSLRY